jgi:hypothetical protein
MPNLQHLSEDFFGIPLTTFRDRNVPMSPFPYGMVISAISILFFRTTIYQSAEPKVLRWFFGSLLAFLTYSNKSYELICSVEIFSYMAPFLFFSSDESLATIFFGISNTIFTRATTRSISSKSSSPQAPPHQQQLVPQETRVIIRIVLIAVSATLCLIVCHLVSTGALLHFANILTPSLIKEGLVMLFPLHEIQSAYDIVDEFILEEGLLSDQVARLFFITFHVQVGIGYLGIDFLKREQERRNQLVQMDLRSLQNDNNDNQPTDDKQVDSSVESSTNDKVRQKQKEKMIAKANQFQRTAAPFIIFTAVPYMIKVIGYGNLNAFAFSCFKDDVHRAIRLYDLFERDNNLVALAEHSAKAPAGTCHVPGQGRYLRAIPHVTDLLNALF